MKNSLMKVILLVGIMSAANGGVLVKSSTHREQMPSEPAVPASVAQVPAYSPEVQAFISVLPDDVVSELKISGTDDVVAVMGKYHDYMEVMQKEWVTTLQEKQNRNITLTLANTALTDEKAALKTERDALKTENQTLTTENQTLTAEKAALTTENQTLTTEKAALTTEKDALTTENQTLTTEKAALTTEKDALKLVNQTLTDANTALKTERDALTDANTALKTAGVELLNAVVIEKDDALTILEGDNWNSDTVIAKAQAFNAVLNTRV